MAEQRLTLRLHNSQLFGEQCLIFDFHSGVKAGRLALNGVSRGAQPQRRIVMSYDVKAYVNGEWCEGDSSGQNLNPATGELLGTYPIMSIAATVSAIDAADRAFVSWRQTPAPKRAAVVFKAMHLMIERQESLAEALCLEQGKTLADARGEVQKSINILEFIAGEGRRINGQTVPSELPNTVAYTVREPLGVVGVITPWNFPVAIPVWKIAPALVTGNTVVFKPAALTPWTGELVTRIFVDAGVPPGVLNMILGRGAVVGDAIVKDERVKALTFTGSNPVGMQLYHDGAARGAKVQCEMGGKNPIVVLEDADIELAAVATAQGAFGSTGQRCTATSRAIVMDEVADAYVKRVVELAHEVVVGNGMKEGVSMGPSVDEKQMNEVLKYLAIGKEEGAKLKCGGERLTEGDFSKGFFVEPTVFDHVQGSMRIAQEEIFGPVLSVIRVKSLDEALEVANGVEYGLTSSIYSKDVNRVFRFLDRIETGITHVNSPTMGGEAQLPFGGAKSTGVGGYREMGPTAIEFYTELKTVYIDYTGTARESKVY
jgi:alpha-ketoglutaric semialdehyde dehydrogenase